jgi:hypothetical protein
VRRESGGVCHRGSHHVGAPRSTVATAVGPPVSPVRDSRSVGVCVVTVYPHERYVVIRVMTALVGVDNEGSPVDVTAHVDVDDALSAIGNFLRGLDRSQQSTLE